MKERMYDALDIAKYVINKCTIDKCPISNLQLQKILYFLQKEFLTVQGRPLFIDEIQAWQFGPVVPNVYYQYCGFGSTPITMLYDVEIDVCDRNIIDSITMDKRTKNPWDLVSETHASGKAWDLIYNDGFGNYKTIPNELIMAKG